MGAMQHQTGLAERLGPAALSQPPAVTCPAPKGLDTARSRGQRSCSRGQVQPSGNSEVSREGQRLLEGLLPRGQQPRPFPTWLQTSSPVSAVWPRRGPSSSQEGASSDTGWVGLPGGTHRAAGHVGGGSLPRLVLPSLCSALPAPVGCACRVGCARPADRSANGRDPAAPPPGGGALWWDPAALPGWSDRVTVILATSRCGRDRTASGGGQPGLRGLLARVGSSQRVSETCIPGATTTVPACAVFRAS